MLCALAAKGSWIKDRDHRVKRVRLELLSPNVAVAFMLIMGELSVTPVSQELSCSDEDLRTKRAPGTFPQFLLYG